MSELLKKIALYGGGSVIALGADVATLALLHYLFNVGELAAAALAFVVGSYVKYVVSMKMVYDDNREGAKTRSIIVFILVALGAMIANHLIIYIGVELLGVNLMISKVVSAGVIFVSNFFLLGILVFKDPLLPSSPKHNSEHIEEENG